MADHDRAHAQAVEAAARELYSFSPTARQPEATILRAIKTNRIITAYLAAMERAGCGDTTISAAHRAMVAARPTASSPSPTPAQSDPATES